MPLLRPLPLLELGRVSDGEARAGATIVCHQCQCEWSRTTLIISLTLALQRLPHCTMRLPVPRRLYTVCRRRVLDTRPPSLGLLCLPPTAHRAVLAEGLLLWCPTVTGHQHHTTMIIVYSLPFSSLTCLNCILSMCTYRLLTPYRVWRKRLAGS